MSVKTEQLLSGVKLCNESIKQYTEISYKLEELMDRIKKVYDDRMMRFSDPDIECDRDGFLWLTALDGEIRSVALDVYLVSSRLYNKLTELLEAYEG